MTIKYLIALLFIAALIILVPHKQETPALKIEQVHTVNLVHTQEAPAVVVASAAITPTPVQPVQQPTDHEELMNLAGIQPEDYGAADYIISHESSWRLYATEPSTGAYGLCQSLPATKMASAGADWQTNPVTQLKWCSSYASNRYGGWWGAYNHWINFHWW